jgi:ubiquinone/menaquinone biosynthesis C-methylase UbiE
VTSCFDLLAHQETTGRTVIASDISPKMLAIAQQRLKAHSEKVRFTLLDVEAMTSIADWQASMRTPCSLGAQDLQSATRP